MYDSRYLKSNSEEIDDDDDDDDDDDVEVDAGDDDDLRQLSLSICKQNDLI